MVSRDWKQIRFAIVALLARRNEILPVVNQPEIPGVNGVSDLNGNFPARIQDGYLALRPIMLALPEKTSGNRRFAIRTLAIENVR